MKKNKEYFKQILKIVLIGIVFYWLLNNLVIIKDALDNILNVLFPFIIGGVMAFLLNIPMRYFENKFSRIKNKKFGDKAKRIVALVLSIVIILGVLLLLINLVIPELVNVLSLLIEKLPYYINKLGEFVNNTLQSDGIKDVIKDINIDIDALKHTLSLGVKEVIISSINAIGSLIRWITNLAIGVVFAFYILLSKEKIKRFGTKVLNAYSKKNVANHILKILTLSNKTFNNFIVGQFTEACILGVLCGLGMALFKLPYALTIAVLVGFTALIPVAGSFIGCTVGALLIVAVDPIKALIFIVFFLVLQQIEGNLIYPKVVGNLVGLPGILVLFAVTIGGNLFGVIGMLIGLPIVSIIYTILKEDVNKKVKET